tara:strand:+ start:976 stop:1305 length:330 start_codon:yes stop_codon:yes gene_type:complete
MNVVRRQFVLEGAKEVMCVGYQSNEVCRKPIQRTPSHRSGVTATIDDRESTPQKDAKRMASDIKIPGRVTQELRSYAASILGEITWGLSGPEIIDETCKHATHFGVAPP